MMCISHRTYMSRICHRWIFYFSVHGAQSYFAIISREWCFPCDMNVISSARAWRSRKIENIWETRVILFGKNITKRVDHGDVGNVISSRPTFERIAATNPIRERFGPSDVYITAVLSDFSPPM